MQHLEHDDYSRRARVLRHRQLAESVEIGDPKPHPDLCTNAALSKQIRRLPVELRKTLTWDRGHEMAAHKEFTIATDVQVYICDPSSPWQRGTNENTNRLLRQYFPKGTDLSGYSQADLNRVALQLNQRPRKTLAFHSPAEVLNDNVALTG